jgi:hypothetical protein
MGVYDGTGARVEIPKQVKIGAYVYRVELVNKPLKRSKKHRREYGPNDEITGEIDYLNGTIKVFYIPNNPHRGLVDFMHECLYGMSEIVQAGLTEEQVTMLAPALTAFLLENGLMRSEPAQHSTPVRKSPAPTEFVTSFRSEVPASASRVMQQVLNAEFEEIVP